MTLYEISQQYLQLMTELCDSDIKDARAAEIEEQIVIDLRTDLDNKLDAYASVMREIEARSEARSNEAKRLQALAKSDASAVERLKNAVLRAMCALDIRKIETRRFRFWRQQNGVAPVVLTNEVPEDYLVYAEPKPNMNAIAEALKANDERVSSFAKFGLRGEHLRIK